MVIARIYGGLGNQMFQYSTARRLALKNNVPLMLDCSWFAEQDLRKYELNIFNINEQFISKIHSKLVRIINDNNNLRGRITSFLLPKLNIINEKHFHFDKNILLLNGNTYLDGYWQSEKYFQDIESVIRKDYSFKPPLAGSNKSLASEIQSSTAVSIHIRRGDYITSANSHQIHGICPIEYYRKCIDLLEQKTLFPSYYVFSDDINWAKDALTSLNKKFIFISHNNTDNGFEDLRLMSLCKHHIIANSSFSWWGAWLSSNPGKMVFAPKQWFAAGHFNTKDLIPDTWLLV